MAAQLASSARTARGIALGVLGVAFVLRGVGDAAGPSGPSWLSWLSPLGWIQFTQPFAAQDWWVLSLPLDCVRRRGTGAGLRAGRTAGPRRRAAAGPARAAPPPRGLLRGPFGLAWRLQRGALAGWAAGYAFTFAACGAAAKGIGQLFGTSTALQREFARLGGQATITNAYLAALMLLAGLVAAAFAISAVLRLRTEETGEPGRGGAGHRDRTGPLGARPHRRRGGRRRGAAGRRRAWRPVSATACGPGRPASRRRG